MLEEKTQFCLSYYHVVRTNIYDKINEDTNRSEWVDMRANRSRSANLILHDRFIGEFIVYLYTVDGYSRRVAMVGDERHFPQPGDMRSVQSSLQLKFLPNFAWMCHEVEHRGSRGRFDSYSLRCAV